MKIFKICAVSVLLLSASISLSQNSWTVGEPVFSKDSTAKWIDFWVICDRNIVRLFYTEGHNGVVMRSTSCENFPHSWSEGKTVLHDVHEAVHVYKVRQRREFHMIYELNNSKAAFSRNQTEIM